VVLSTGVTSQGWRLSELMLLFLNNRTKVASENMLPVVVLEIFSDNSSACSYCSLIIQNHVICMLKEGGRIMDRNLDLEYCNV
jgi:hypothetical protein